MVAPVIREMASYYSWSDAEKATAEEELRETLAKNDLSDLK